MPFDTFSSTLSNDENRSSLPCIYQKLFEKYSPVFFFNEHYILMQPLHIITNRSLSKLYYYDIS
jgi:hypothetical protein